MRPELSVGLVPSTPTNERQALDVGIVQDGVGERALALAHRLEGNALRRLGDGLDQAGVLDREEALGDHDIEQRPSARRCRPRSAGSAAGGGTPRSGSGRRRRSSCRTSARPAPRPRDAPAVRPSAAWPGRWRRSWAHIIGTRVSETTAEIRMVTESVTANSLNRRPTTSPMNSSGISTAISDTVSDTTVKAIWPEPLSAASLGIVAVARCSARCSRS